MQVDIYPPPCQPYGTCHTPVVPPPTFSKVSFLSELYGCIHASTSIVRTNFNRFSGACNVILLTSSLAEPRSHVHLSRRARCPSTRAALLVQRLQLQSIKVHGSLPKTGRLASIRLVWLNFQQIFPQRHVQRPFPSVAFAYIAMAASYRLSHRPVFRWGVLSPETFYTAFNMTSMTTIAIPRSWLRTH
jgi:hypothetical protein